MVEMKLKVAVVSTAAILALATAASADSNVLFGGSFTSGDFVADSHAGAGGSGDWRFRVDFSGKGAQIDVQLYSGATPFDADADEGGPDNCGTPDEWSSGTPAGVGSGTLVGKQWPRDLTVTAVGSVTCIRAVSTGRKGTFRVLLVDHP